MIKGVRSFHYPVRDALKAVNFYVQALGMTFDYAQPDWVALKIDGMQIGLRLESEIHFIPRDDIGATAGGCLTLTSDDIPNDRKRLEEFGAKILGEATGPLGHCLVFEDLDGNVLKLLHPAQ